MKPLTRGEKRLLSYVMNDVYYRMNHASCNDLCDEFRECLTKKEYTALESKAKRLYGPEYELMDLDLVYHLIKRLKL